ncbi:WXG100 family type VII secretion target [Microbacterium sp. WCS2018Hpa-23]|uniref:WXG100 family type VII secretion target n=1 Tax=Microbacterium sp. WCS2018Hpa-23 TaxID=3073634 RepID=UPI0028834C0E|nr:WXG100 family type VII secretion target [Microbacterium sp. WCS2018Hpa-23]
MDLKVDPDRLAEAAASSAASAAAIVESLDSLAGTSQDLRSRWEGEAQNAYTRRSSALDSQWRLHAGTLRLSAERAARLADEYRQADSDGARAVLGF